MTTERHATAPSYVSGASETPLLGLSIGDAFDRTVARWPEREALIVRHQGLRYTWTQLQAEVNRTARGLMAFGVERGERVGVWSPNRAEWVITQYAAAKIGAILVNVNPAYRLHELEYALNQSGCAALVTAPRFRATDYTAMLHTLLPELRGDAPKTAPRASADPSPSEPSAGAAAPRRGTLASAKLPALRHIIRLENPGDAPAPGMWAWRELLARGDDVSVEALAARQAEAQFDDPVNIQYTSGTTGSPKGATLSHHNILNNGYFVARLQGFTEADRLCAPVPAYHCFGCVMATLGCLTHGATLVYPSEAFEPQAVLQAVQEERCTALYGVPTMFIAELAEPDFASYDLSSLRTGVMAGSPCPTEVMKQVIERMRMREVEICYGMTETSPVSFQSHLDTPLERRVATVGQIHPHVEVKIVDPATGQVVSRGTPGELLTRGYSVMLGYWNNDEATRATIDQARWMHTGDLATLDADGYATIVGRLKDMVIRGGENIYPREVEEFLYAHPKIADVQVIGVPDAKYGEELMAWVKLREGESATGEELAAFCRGQIASYKIPRYWKFVGEFPMTVTGKVQKFVMREQAVVELGLRDVARAPTA